MPADSASLSDSRPESPSEALPAPHGGHLVVDVLEAEGVTEIFTLCGGHISPILVAAEQRGIRIVDVRHEASAAFAADAVSRLGGRPGVCAVTAGPGLTNTVTAVKNAQMAQSPLVLLGGATGTILKGRGSLQDIDQEALLEPHVKWMAAVDRVRDLPKAVSRAFAEARLGVPGPTFVECPVDLLYAEPLIREQYGVGPSAKPPRSLVERATRVFLSRHVDKLFRGAFDGDTPQPAPHPIPQASGREVSKVAKLVRRAKRPLVVVGSQATLRTDRIDDIAAALGRTGLPAYLSGMARGLLGERHDRHFRHQRRVALREADLVLLLGVPQDFRLDYGRHIPRKTPVVGVNLDDLDLIKNRKPKVPILGDPGLFLIDLAAALDGRSAEKAAGQRAARWSDWLGTLGERDAAREADIDRRSEQTTDFVNPIHLFRVLDSLLPDDSVLVADGGDFVATASYTLRPRGPLRWLDPGVFGTLGVGGGFALGAKVARPSAEVWLLWGDGSAAYSLAEFDAFARHGLPVIALVGNDAGWTQIAREQVEILGAATATELAYTDYHRVAEGYGGVGLLLETPEAVRETLEEAQRIARSGKPVLINCKIGATDFRKGSISM